MANYSMQVNQRGMTYLGMMFLMVVIAFFAVIVIKVVPVYLENYKVKSSLTSLASDPGGDLAKMSNADLEKRLLARFDINDVEHVTKDDITIRKEDGNTVIEVDYEARVPLFMNIDLVARFPDNRVDLGSH